MKGSENFKSAIWSKLQSLAEQDAHFNETFKKPGKNLDDCIKYIFNQVKQSGCSGFDDSEIYNMAIHYYDEDNIEVGGEVNGHVVVNHVVQLTPEEVAKAKDAAIESLMSEEKAKLQRKAIRKNTTSDNQQSLF